MLSLQTTSELFTRDRNGFSRTDAVGVLVVLVILASVVVLFFQQGQVGSRNAWCNNYLKQYSIAIANYEQSNGHLPYLYDHELSTRWDEGSWQRALFPYMDEAAYHESLSEGTASIPPGEFQPKYMACQTDPTAWKTNGRTSYVANLGYIASDLDFSNDAEMHSPDFTDSGEPYDYADGSEGMNAAKVFSASGVFVRANGKGIVPSLASIAGQDGTTQTLMLAENLHAGRWYGENPFEYGFGVTIDVDRAAERPADRLLTHDPDVFPTDALSRPNASVGAPNGPVPQVSSNHGGFVNVAFCDGHTSTVSDGIDPGVWARLISSGGGEYGQATDDFLGY